jgi:hypothetical protein
VKWKGGDWITEAFDSVQTRFPSLEAFRAGDAKPGESEGPLQVLEVARVSCGGGFIAL